MNIKLATVITSALIFASTGLSAAGYTENKVKNIINSMDDNADDKVRFQEYYEETVTDNRDTLDRNKDGFVTAGEVANEIKEDLVETIKHMRETGVSEKQINRMIAKELHTAETEAAELIKKMDLDGDHLVEPEEFKAYKKKQFSKLDINNDGVISSADSKKQKGFPIRIHNYK